MVAEVERRGGGQMFLGTYTPKLDDKGRLTLPAKFRDALAGGLMVTKSQDHANLSKDCVVIGSVDYLEIWDAQAWQEYQETHEENFSAASDEALGDII
jgi:DNA-binding transcriptional regulator/RsmH inhibitor MraZ